MNYGLYLSAAGMQVDTWRQDVIANNLANAGTVGFKRDLAVLQQRDPESIEDPQGLDVSRQLLDKLGGGVLVGPRQISFAPGPMEKTNEPHDVALDQADTFLAVLHRDANTGAGSVQLTRDGRLTRDAQGYLVTSAGGHRVLDPADAPIRLSPTQTFTFGPDGSVLQDGQPVARLQITGVKDLNLLVKKGGNLFGTIDGKDIRKPVEGPSVRPEHVEASGVDPIKALMELVAATKSASNNANMIRYHDLLMDRAINVLGRVA